MQQSRSLSGAAEAIERSKNAGSEAVHDLQDAAGKVADRAKRAYDETREIAGEAYDQAGEAYRTGSYYVRRHPLESLLVVGTLAFAAGLLLRRDR
jgi:ElaB/YqjD/DUF883 family membrane-anchored ribosome-binding protein